MRISDWSSDVCSSDLRLAELLRQAVIPKHFPRRFVQSVQQRFSHDNTRRNGVAANALRTVLRGDIFRKCIDGAFAGGIGGRIEIAPLCRARTDVDDGAAALRYHERQCMRSEEHTSELQSLMRISYAV